MTDHSYEGVRVFLGENNVQVRRSLADSIRHQGFHEVRDTDEFEILENAVALNEVDVLVCNGNLPGGNVCELIRGIRHNEVGSNPFIVVVVLIEDSSSSVVDRLIDCGADDIVKTPWSVGLVLERLSYLARNRKGFVVTSDYIGPDRRQTTRPGVQRIPIISVPNPFLLNDHNKLGFRDAVQHTINVVNDQKMQRHLVQIDWLVTKIMKAHGSTARERNMMPHLAKLLVTAEDLVQRMQGTPLEHVCELGTALADVVRSVGENAAHLKEMDLRLLPELSAAIRKAFDTDGEVVAAVHDISTSLERRKLDQSASADETSTPSKSEESLTSDTPHQK